MFPFEYSRRTMSPKLAFRLPSTRAMATATSPASTSSGV